MSNKKLWLLILFIFLGINHVSAMTPTVEYIDNVYSNRVSDSKTYSGQLGFIVMDGKILYCLEPYLIIGKDYSVDNSYFNNYSKEDKEYFELVASYVEEKVNNRNVYYYMAAQELIWERIIGDRVYWTTEKNGQVEINITEYKDEIKKYVEQFYTKPFFDSTLVKEDYFKEVTLADLNEVLPNYEIVSENNSIVTIEGNNLKIVVATPEKEKVRFIRRKNGSESIYYHHDNNQNLAYLSGTIEVESSLEIETNHYDSMKLEIDFYDEGYNVPISGELKFKIHNLDTNDYSEEFVTNTGNYLSDFKLGSGHYEIILTAVPKNFYISKNYEFEISDDNYNEVYHIICLLGSAQARINIKNNKENKNYELYSSEEVYDIYGNLIFEKNQNIANLEIPDSNSYITVLPFGKYCLLDTSDQEKYCFEINYKDQYTPLVDYFLNIDKKDDRVDEKEDNKKDDQVDEKEDNKKDDQVDEKEDDKKDDQVDEKEDNKKDDQVEEKDNQENEKDDQDKNQNIKENPKIDDNKMEEVSGNTKESTIDKNNTDQDIEKVLPNTYNYIGFIKLLLFVVIIFDILIIYPKNNE